MYDKNAKEGADELLFPVNAYPQSKVNEIMDANIAQKRAGIQDTTQTQQ